MNHNTKPRVHIKNNHAATDTFPNTPEGEEVFTITQQRFTDIASGFPGVADQLDVFIDWDEDNFRESMAIAEILICWNLPTENLATVAPKLKWIHCIGAGVEHLAPMDWLPEGTRLTNNKGVHARKAGEYGLMAILMLHNSIPIYATNQRTATYNSIYSTPIDGKNLLIVGAGSMGSEVGRLAKFLGINVTGITRHGNPNPNVDQMFTVEKLDELLPGADFVFLSTPLTPETDNLFNRERLGLMKKGSGLINIGRAAVVDYEALINKLNANELSGVILDVFDPEPLPADSPLWHTPNLFITPHVSADDGASYVALTLDLFFKNMQRYLAGDSLLNEVRPDLGY